MQYILEFYNNFSAIWGGLIQRLCKRKACMLALYDNEPVATSLVYCEQQIEGIYAMSTREKFLRKRLGFAVAQACLETAKNKNISYPILSCALCFTGR
jgi:hypothetical protein